MKILSISDRGSFGGAAIAGGRVSVALAQQGYHTTIYSAGKFPPPLHYAHNTYQINEPPSTKDSTFRFVLKRHKRRPSPDAVHRHMDDVIESYAPDCIILHNIHIDYPGWGMDMLVHLLSSYKKIPIIWLLHDMWAMTAGCPYNYSCRRFEAGQGCDELCPQAEHPLVPSEPEIAKSQKRRAQIYSESENLIFLAPSKWLQQEMNSSGMPPNPALQINYPFPLEKFVNADKTLFRRVQDIPENRDIYLLSSSVSFTDQRKGSHILCQSMKIIDNENLRLIFLGTPPSTNLELPIRIHFLGYRSGYLQLAEAYNTADLFIHPSLADNQPLSIIEAMACGLPVVALPVGGVPELVREGETGWLAKEPTAEALAEAIQRALEARDRWPEYSSQCRRFVEENFSMGTIGRRYDYLIREMINGNIQVTQQELDSIR